MGVRDVATETDTLGGQGYPGRPGDLLSGRYRMPGVPARGEWGPRPGVSHCCGLMFREDSVLQGIVQDGGPGLSSLRWPAGLSRGPRRYAPGVLWDVG